ncbi:MAG TPA: branched-chain amino acid ABC transporter ATP-binding protein/permease [Acidimicrobiales bacterium]|nr:branched-chain amino acid ABC transporter ATP-binding protein/permease [Acidimicrobiales bacterium]
MRPRLPELTPRLYASAAGVLLVLLAPVLPGVHGVQLSIFVGVIATAIAALSLDVLVGRTGQLSLAHAAFLGIGAFATVNVGGRGAPWPIALLGGAAVTAVVATIAGLPSLRIRGLQIAIVTLALQYATEQYVFKNQTLTAATQSLDRPSLIRTDASLYFFAVVLLGVVLLVRRRVSVTRTGRALLAVRDVEARAPAFGVEPGPTKLLAYTLSGAMVGLAGALLAFKNAPGTLTSTDPFVLLQSLLLVAIVIVGGAGSGPGIVAAAFFIAGVPQLFNTVTVPFTHVHVKLGVYAPLVSAFFLVVSIVLQPTGIGGVVRDLFERLRRRGTEPPSPRPRLVDLGEASHAAADLRQVPRSLALRMPVRALLEAEHVTVQYGGVTALSDVTLEVRRGEIVGLIGANGAGKSTFFNAASGFAPTTGSIRYRGVELLDNPPSKRTSYGLARTFQDMGLVRAETVKENVLLAQTWLARYPAAAGLLALGATIGSERELRRRADVALELFGLDHLSGERLGDLPYGTMRIVEIASAVAAGPDLLLLDEATAGLGPEEAHALGDRFLALRDQLGLTLVVIEHHVPLIARVCDYCYCLESGALIAEGTPAFVTAQPRVVESFLGRAAAASGGAKK